MTITHGFVSFVIELDYIGDTVLTSREVVKRINRWTRKPKANVPVCRHNESHGRLKAELWGYKIPFMLKPDLKKPGRWKADWKCGFFFTNAEVLMVCTKCSFKLLSRDIPGTAFRKTA